MPHDRREGPIVISLSGERAERLATRLLSPRPSAAEALLAEITGQHPSAGRVAHDWDPATRRLTLVARGG